MARVYRLHPDSSYLEAPRVFSRVFCGAEDLVATVRFYEELVEAGVELDVDIPEAGVRVVGVGPFLVVGLSSPENALVAETRVTVLNADLGKAVAKATAAGATIVQERWESAVGAGVRLRHPDGLIAEYVEHRPGEFDVPEPGPEFRER